MADFALGDVVRVKSGGPMMTVHSVKGDGTIVCVWMDSVGDGHKMKAESFAAHVLKKMASAN